MCGAGADSVEELRDDQARLPGERAAEQRSAGNRPFSAKHARQQASIIGHLRRLGLLQVMHSAPALLHALVCMPPPSGSRSYLFLCLLLPSTRTSRPPSPATCGTWGLSEVHPLLHAALIACLPGCMGLVHDPVAWLLTLATLSAWLFWLRAPWRMPSLLHGPGWSCCPRAAVVRLSFPATCSAGPACV